MAQEFTSEYMTITKREDGLYDISTDAGYIGTVMKSQLEKAERILKQDMYGRNFYTYLNR
jgi:hypothetical protein